VFVINTDGSIQEVEVVRGIGGGCDEEAIKVVKIALSGLQERFLVVPCIRE